MDPIDTIINILFVVVVIYIISRFAHNSKEQTEILKNIEKKMDDLLKK